MAVRTFVRRCWLLLRPHSGPAYSFSLSCECGGVVAGERKTHPQILPCPRCRQPLFVMPSSPWPFSASERASDLPAAPPGAGRATRLRAWWLPLLTGLVTLALVSVGFCILLTYLSRTPKPDGGVSGASVEEIRKQTTSARGALANRNYHQAFKDADAARELSERNPSLLDRDERFQVEQLYRQSDLLARLLGSPLQEIVHEASLAQEDEWQTRFTQLYEGRSVLFDDLLRSDAVGRPTLGSYEVRVGEERVRVAVEDLRVLRHLPLDPPPRVLFGARLAKVVREQGVWVIRFDPASGVLLTDQEAASCVPLDDALIKVLDWQREWLRKNPDQN